MLKQLRVDSGDEPEHFTCFTGTIGQILTLLWMQLPVDSGDEPERIAHAVVEKALRYADYLLS